MANHFAETDVSTLVTFLSNGKWNKSDAIKRSLGLSPRTVRAIAEKHGDKIIGTGIGYKSVASASAEEITWAYNSLISRSRKLLQRADSLKRRNVVH